nr:FUSC family protein [Kibdelosporangium sp. MJ126-NF4]CEL16340.1 integral membrane protein [Kibdelosporangium sp. MJ126-NF4]CTQ94264.1 integral membrane protein [Kibdelosporangium sp. MJ126-NF4]
MAKSTVESKRVAAPHWLVQLVRPVTLPVPWRRITRAAIAITGPIAIGLALGRLDVGVIVSMGALCATLADADGPYRYRAKRIGWAAVGGAIGFFLGSLAGGHGWWSAAVIVGLAGISALISASGNIASLAALQMLVFAALGAGQPRDTIFATLWFLAGTGVVWMFALAAWPFKATGPERAAVAEVYDEIAVMLAASGTAGARTARRDLTTALNNAYDALLTARSRLSGRDQAYRRLMTLLADTTPVVEASVALVNVGRQPPAEVVLHMTAVAEAIRLDGPLPQAPEFDEPTRGHAALRAGLEGLSSPTGKRDHRDPEDHVPFRERLETVFAGRVAWSHAARLMLCMAVAEFVGWVLKLEYPYWVALTVAIVLKPDFGSVFGRAVLRGLGTLLGVLLGALVLAFDPRGWVLVLLVALIAGALPYGRDRNYGMFSTFVTPLVIVQLDLAHTSDWGLVGARLVDTALGCAIVLVFGYLLWPGSLRPRVGTQLLSTLESLSAYIEHGLSGSDNRVKLRRDTYRELSDLRNAFQQAVVEPSAAGLQAAAWWPVIVTLERAADAVTGLAVGIQRGAEPIEPDAIETLTDAVAEAGASIREERPPQRMPMPDVDRLTRLVTELVSVLATLRGPDWYTRTGGQIVRRLLQPVRRER